MKNGSTGFSLPRTPAAARVGMLVHLAPVTTQHPSRIPSSEGRLTNRSLRYVLKRSPLWSDSFLRLNFKQRPWEGHMVPRYQICHVALMSHPLIILGIIIWLCGQMDFGF